MPSGHIYYEIIRARQTEIAAAAAQRQHSVEQSRRTRAVRTLRGIRLVRGPAGATA